MTIQNKFEIGQTVYLATDQDQSPKMVTAITVSHKGLQYTLSGQCMDSYHFDFEIAEIRNPLMGLN